MGSVFRNASGRLARATEPRSLYRASRGPGPLFYTQTSSPPLASSSTCSAPLRGYNTRSPSNPPATISISRSSSYLARPFASTTSRSDSSSSTSGQSDRPETPPSTKDPGHPYLWYHPLPTHHRIALSFLSDSPIPGSRTVLGYLPLGAESGLNDFQENPDFLPLLQDLIGSGLKKGVSQEVEFEASTRPTDGYLNISDERAIPPAGRIAEPEDTIGTVFVQGGKVDAGTYQPMPSYRLITGDGPCILPKGLDEYVRGELARIDKEEKEAV